MHEIIIPMVPSRNILRGDGWWRNAHNDRVVWRERVKRAMDGVVPNTYQNASVVFDWGSRPMPRIGVHSAVDVLGEAMSEHGMVVRFCHAELQQSGRGQGETRVVLESNACLGDA